MARPINWLLSPLPVFKLSTIVCFLLIIIFFLEGRNQWVPYSVIFFFSFTFVLLILFSLVIHYFNISQTNKQIPWIKLEILLNVFGFLVCAASAVILAYDWWLLKDNKYSHHRLSAPVSIGQESWTRRVFVVIAVLIVTALLFLMTLGRVKKAGLL